ncbi:MAG TPA: dienelactone hydrolase family protein [Gammaproteobacteria bacterium]|nr:dienelactone hydrolase family protein [Gammaproteobacteria bacterium]
MHAKYLIAQTLLAAALCGLPLMPAGSAETPAAAPQPLEIKHADVQYALIKGQLVHGYLSQPAEKQSGAPGLILIHMWWGLNQHMRDLADRLARKGYVVLVVDLFDGRTTRDPREAAHLADIADANPNATLANLEQAVSYMTAQQHVNHLGVIGWSIGGRWAFRIASDLPQAFDALAVFYAAPYTEPSQLAPLRMPMLAFFGGRDPFVPAEVVDKFQWAAGLASATLDIHIYPDASAAFDDPDSTAYNPRDAEDAWRQLDAFLARNLKKVNPRSS